MMLRVALYAFAAVPLLTLAAFAAAPRAGAAAQPPRRRDPPTAAIVSGRRLSHNSGFTLRGVDARCFYAPGGAMRGWPWDGPGPFPIRGSFNEVRTLAGSHFGVDVAAPHDKAEVHALAPGIVLDHTRHTMTIADGHGHRWTYWHLAANSLWHRGMMVRPRAVLGRIEANVWHVHISEWVGGCGWVDPRRPTGNFWNPANTQSPMIGVLSAARAGTEAFAVPPTVGAAPPPDPATAEPLDHLTGVVDLRAAAVVAGPGTPIAVVGGETHIPDLAVSAIRAWLTVPDRPHSHLEMRMIMDGSRLVSNPDLWHKWAWGTWRSDACFYGHGACGQTMVWHVGGPQGLDTRAYRDGRYLYCVEALTINDVSDTRCTRIAIAN